MAHFSDNDNAYSDPSTYAVGNIGGYPNLTLAPANETSSVAALNNLANPWVTTECPGFMVDPLTISMVPKSHNSMPVATSYFALSGYPRQPSYTGGFQPEVPAQPQPPYQGNFLFDVPAQLQTSYPRTFLSGVPVQPQPANPSGWGGSFASNDTLKAPSVVPRPVNFSFGNLGENENGFAFGTPCPQNWPTDCQPRVGPVGTTPVRKRHSHLYDPYRARTTEYVNVEPGPLTLPPHIPTVGPPTGQPSGGHSVTMADAEQNQTSVEEDETPTPKQTRAPRGTGESRRCREEAGEEMPKLIWWAKMFQGVQHSPSINEALAEAAKAIPTIRIMVNQQPLLATAPKNKVLGPGTKATMRERARREIESGWYRLLSQYYPLDKGRWKRAQLLREVVRDVETHPDLRRTPSKEKLELGAPAPRNATRESQ